MGKGRVVLYILAGAVFLCIVRLQPAGAGRTQQTGTAQYVERVLTDEAEFALKSPANKNLKRVREGKYRCMEGHWHVMGERPVFLCD